MGKALTQGRTKLTGARLAGYPALGSSRDRGVGGCTATVSGPHCITFILVVYEESESPKPYIHGKKNSSL